MLSNSFTLLAKCPEAEVGDYLLARVNGELRGKELLIAPEGLAALIRVYSDIMGERSEIFSVEAVGDGSGFAKYYK